MRRLATAITLSLVFIAVGTAGAQGFFYKLTHPDAIGGGFVATHIDGAGESTAFGPGLEVFAKYNLNIPGLHASVGTGFYRATDGMLTHDTYWRNMIPTFEVKVGYDILQKERFSPFLFAGAQGYMFNTINDSKLYGDGTLFGGGGFRYELNQKMNIYASGDYRYALTDPAKAKYWVAKAGVSLNLNPRKKSRETMEYPMDESDLALQALFKDMGGQEQPASQDDKPTEEDALALLFTEEESSADGVKTESVDPLDELFRTDTGSDDAMPSASGNTAAAPEVNRLMARINDLRNEMEQKDRELIDLRGKVAANEKNIMQITRGVAGQMAGYTDNALAELDFQNFKSGYQQALKHHYNKDYSRSIQTFRALLNAQPDHRLASNCQYWIGESFNAMGRHSEAIAAFNKVLNYNSSYKLDDALIMSGIVNLKIGNENDARQNFQRLVSNFPDSEYAPKAMRYLGRL